MMRLCVCFFFFFGPFFSHVGLETCMHDLSCILSGLHDGGGGNDAVSMVADF